MNKRHYEHTLPNIRGSLSNTYVLFKYNIFICLLNKNNMTMKLHILAYGLVLATTVAACSDEKKILRKKKVWKLYCPHCPMR